MNVVLNGERADIDDGATVTELVSSLVASRKGVAVAVNGEVVPRSTWNERHLDDGDKVEVLNAVGGG